MSTASSQVLVAQRTGRRRPWWFRLLVLVLASAAASLAGEWLVRRIGQQDADGNFVFRGRILGPREPPVAKIRSLLHSYQSSTRSRMVYDPELGWSPHPDYRTSDGRYAYNHDGIRSAPCEYDPVPAPGMLRIALFGDSFTHGDDVDYEHTWGRCLQQTLESRDVRAEVINFGVPAYGMDQAYLRWQTLGRGYRPHVVVFGFQAENVCRNVNLIRAFYVPHTGIPFSKPRFVLAGNGGLELINSPTVPLDELVAVMADMPHWPLAKHEWHYRAAGYRRRFWHHSRLLSLALAVCSRSPRAATSPARVCAVDCEPAQLALGILADFRDDVRQHGAEFCVLHVPARSDLGRRLAGRPLEYAALLEAICRRHPVVDPQPALLAAAEQSSLEEIAPRHYTPRGNRILALELGDFLVEEIQE